MSLIAFELTPQTLALSSWLYSPEQIERSIRAELRRRCPRDDFGMLDLGSLFLQRAMAPPERRRTALSVLSRGSRPAEDKGTEPGPRADARGTDARDMFWSKAVLTATLSEIGLTMKKQVCA